MKDTVTKGGSQRTFTSIRQQDARNRRKRFFAAFLVYTPIMFASFWLFSSISSCGAPTTTPLPTAESSSTPLQQEYAALIDRAASELQGNSPDRDYEVNYLNKRLNKHGVTAERVNPRNPEHQRRYRRHFLGDLNPRMEMTPWQIHKVHYSPSNGTLFNKDCPYCQKNLVDQVPYLGL